MDSNAQFTLVVVAAMIIYALFEYQKREQLHREAMEYLKRDLVPPAPSTRPKLMNIVTTGLVCLALLIVTGGFIFLAVKRGGGNMLLTFLSFAFIFGALFVMSLAMCASDIRRYRSERISKTGGQP